MASDPSSEMREHEAPDARMRPILLDLTQRLSVSRDRYEHLVEWRSATTARTEFASKDRRSLQPLELERHGLGLGRILRQRPTRGWFVEDFFDVTERWIANCRHDNPYGYYEEFFEQDGESVFGTLFDYSAPDKRALNCSLALCPAGVVNEYVRLGAHGWRYETYHRDAEGRVVEIATVVFSPAQFKAPRSNQITVDYGVEGRIISMTQVWDTGEVEQLPPRDGRA